MTNKEPTLIHDVNESETEPQLFAVSRKPSGVKFNRRQFIEFAAATAVVATVTGCDSGTEEETTTAQVSAVTVAPSKTTSPTRAPTATSRPSATDTPVRTNTPTKTATPTRTPTPTPAPLPEVTVVLSSVNLRGGPGTIYPVIGSARLNDIFAVIGRNTDGSWFQIIISSDQIGWIGASVVSFDFDIDDIPVAEDIPTPPPVPATQAVPQGTPGGTIAAGETGIQYTVENVTYTLPCGSPIPAGAVCICNCVTAPPACSCVGHVCSCDTVCTCDSVCTCEGHGHYWYPN